MPTKSQILYRDRYKANPLATAGGYGTNIPFQTRCQIHKDRDKKYSKIGWIQAYNDLWKCDVCGWPRI